MYALQWKETVCATCTSARYAVVEGGTSQRVLNAYLQEHYPQLRHSIPDAPPTTTIAANAALHGQGRLTQQYGFNSEMVTGLEVVLPTGEICLIGSPSLGPYWFSRGPTMPDLSALFLGWLGTTGIITKIGLRLYPNKKIRDVELFVTDRVDLIPDILYKLTHLEILGAGEDSASRIRVREARDTGARIIAVACPSCAKMLSDAVKTEGLEETLEVLGIAEIIERARAK